MALKSNGPAIYMEWNELHKIPLKWNVESLNCINDFSLNGHGLMVPVVRQASITKNLFMLQVSLSPNPVLRRMAYAGSSR